MRTTTVGQGPNLEMARLGAAIDEGIKSGLATYFEPGSFLKALKSKRNA